MNILVIIAWVGFAVWATKIGYQKGHPFAGLMLGATLAYVGVVVIAFFPSSKTRSRELPTGTEIATRVREYRTVPPMARQRGGKHAA
jgi:hypothetical protein